MFMSLGLYKYVSSYVPKATTGKKIIFHFQEKKNKFKAPYQSTLVLQMINLNLQKEQQNCFQVKQLQHIQDNVIQNDAWPFN